MVEVVARAFLSYAHADNDREHGRILRLAQLIAEEFESLTGTRIEIFTDAAIKWGQDFRDKLNEALQETTFFIPVLTPTFFLRDECRNEMSQFAASAKALGLEELLLSIRYLPVSDMREGSTDELKDLAARMQYEPWDELRLEDESAAPYRKGINRLAQRLVELTSRLESKPVDAPVTLRREPREGDDGQQSDEPEDDLPGLVDLAAELQPSLEWLNEVTTRLTPATQRWTSLLDASTKGMVAANSKPNAFAAKIVAAREFASEAEEPLAEIEMLSKDYSMALLRLDPSVRAVLSMAARSSEDPTSFEPFLGGLEQIIRTAVDNSETLLRAAASAQETGNLSRDLRPVFRRYATAVRNIADGRTIVESWQPLIDDLRAQQGTL